MNQTSIFDFINEDYKITKPIRLIELFAGIGSQAKALQRIGANFEHHKVVEFDKYAIKSYNAVHGTNFETSDVTQIHSTDLEISDTNKFTYLLTYSFPCQSLSVAGKGEGMKKGTGTRSGLLWEVERILHECDELPQVLLMENVPQVHGKKNIDDFNKWIESLENLGYSNYWQDLNAKDFGIPQNRKRCFMVSILGNHKYTFPTGFELKLRLKDMLEDEVDEKYFIDEKYLKNLIKNINVDELIEDKKLVPVRIGNIYGEQFGTGYAGNVWDKEAISPTLMTMQGGNRQPFITEPIICRSVGRNPENPSSRKAGEPTEQRLEINKSGCSNTLTTVQKDNYVLEPCALDGSKSIEKVINKPKLVGGIGERNFGSQYRQGNRIYDANAIAMYLNASPIGNAGGYSYLYKTDLRIRKLTPKECWRLMGFDDEDIDKAISVGMSNSQLYKQAGNSIVVDVLEAIFKQLL